MFFAGAKGVEKTTTTINGVSTSTTIVKNPTTQIFVDGSGKLGSSGNSSKIEWNAESVKFGEISIDDDGNLVSLDSSDSNIKLTFGNGKILLNSPNGSSMNITPSVINIKHDDTSVVFGDCAGVGMELKVGATGRRMFCPGVGNSVGIMAAASDNAMVFASAGGQFGGFCPKTTVTSNVELSEVDVDQFTNVVIADDSKPINITGGCFGKWVRIINITSSAVTINFKYGNSVIHNISSYSSDYVSLTLPSNKKVELHCINADDSDEDYILYDWLALN